MLIAMKMNEIKVRAALAAFSECVKFIIDNGPVEVRLMNGGCGTRILPSNAPFDAAEAAVKFADALMERLEDKKWSLSDARDGDILVSRNGNPFIYNGYRDEHWVGAYCGIDTAGYFLISESQNYWTSSEGVSLASGTDVNILFRKMYEDGYIWIPGKKEIKKIKEYKK